MSTVSDRMRRQAVKDTAPEMALRRALHAAGARYRVHRRPLPERRVTADIVFTKAKVAVFLDGCFWHCCPEHGTRPKTNADWWAAKLDRNVERDREADRRLAESGWTVIRVWEHEHATEAAQRILKVIR